MSENNTAYNGAKKIESGMKIKMRSFALVFRIYFTFFMILFFLSVYQLTNKIEVRYAGFYIKAYVISDFRNDPDELINYQSIGDKKTSLSAKTILTKKIVIRHFEGFEKTLIYALFISLFLAIPFTMFVMFLFRKMDKSGDNSSKLIRGSKLMDEKELSKMVISDGLNSHLRIGQLPILKDAETQQIYISGAIGCGKGNAIKGLLDSICENKTRFIVYDKSGEYVSKYYRVGIDIILNPFDERMPFWSPWIECESAFDYEMIATSFLPDSASQKDEHWTEAPRTVLADLLQTLENEDMATIDNLFTYAQDKNMLYDLLQGTPSAQILDPDSAEHASSVLSILMPKIKALKYLNNIDSDEFFSLRHWVRDETSDQRIFITCSQRQKKSIQPLMTAWLDIIISEILSLPEDRNRRIFSIIDELASLDCVNSLYDGINEGRKFGLCHIISVTSMEAFKEKYGDKKAKTMIGMCSTKINFRCDEPETAKWLADLYGEEDVQDAKQSLTISSNNDSTNMHDQRTKRNILLPTEFMDLPDKLAVVKLGKAYPIAKVDVPYVPRKDIAKPMMLKEYKPIKNNSVDESYRVIESNLEEPSGDKTSDKEPIEPIF